MQCTSFIIMETKKISIENKIPTKLIMIFVSTFGLFHGIAHGLEVPAAANPVLFVLGFIFGKFTKFRYQFSQSMGHSKKYLNFTF